MYIIVLKSLAEEEQNLNSPATRTTRPTWLANIQIDWYRIRSVFYPPRSLSTISEKCCQISIFNSNFVLNGTSFIHPVNSAIRYNEKTFWRVTHRLVECDWQLRSVCRLFESQQQQQQQQHRDLKMANAILLPIESRSNPNAAECTWIHPSLMGSVLIYVNVLRE